MRSKTTKKRVTKMGLDMYLIAKKFVWHDDSKLANAIRNAVPCPFSDKPRYIEYTAMYWRKANAIHNWFVQNVQSGNDDCDHYDVSKDELIALRDLCDIVIATAKQIPGQVKIGEISTDGKEFIPEFKDGMVIENPEEIESLMPTTNGFFFGSTNYDEYYLNDIKETKQVIDKILNSDTTGWEFEYYSSW